MFAARSQTAQAVRQRGSIVLFFTISDFYLNCGRVGSFQALVLVRLRYVDSSGMNANVYLFEFDRVINVGIISNN